MEELNFLKNAKIDGERLLKTYLKPNKLDLFNQLSKSRLHVIYGMRGGGKTTLLFQKFNTYPKHERIYINGEEINLLKLRLYDLFRKLNYIMDKGAVFIDEITKIKNWAEEIKIIYDKYPEYELYISGSSTIQLDKSKQILARRALYHHLLPMTFREFLRIRYNINLNKFNINKDLFSESIKYDIYFKEKIDRNPIELVNEFISKNLPFLLKNDKRMLMDLIDKIIYEDIATTFSFDISIINKFHRLILLLATSEKTTYENISNDLGISKSVVGNMIRALINSSVIKPILPYGSGRIVGRKTWKYMFLVPAIRELYMEKAGSPISKIKGYTLEDIITSHMDHVFYLNEGDFVYKSIFIEVGSKRKTIKQLRNLKEKNRVVIYNGSDVDKKDSIIKIPAYLFLCSF